MQCVDLWRISYLLSILVLVYTYRLWLMYYTCIYFIYYIDILLYTLIVVYLVYIGACEALVGQLRRLLDQDPTSVGGSVGVGGGEEEEERVKNDMVLARYTCWAIGNIVQVCQN